MTTTTKFSVTKMSLKFSTNCEGCGRMFKFESNNLADLDASRWPTKCEDCLKPKAELKPTPVKKQAPRTFRVMFCVNDDRGNPSGRVEEIDIGEEMRLSGPSRACRFEGVGADRRVRIGRRLFPCRGHAPWVGNIFWDATSMTLEPTRELVKYLLANGWVIEEHAEKGPLADLARTAA